jgi:peptide/nickel transport system substrate-binding protein
VKQRNAKVASVEAARVNFVQFDVAREVLLGVTPKSGEQIPNPFKNPLVRPALALAVNRGILIDKILAGYGTAAAQVFPLACRARRRNCSHRSRTTTRQGPLLAKAGFPDGSILSSPDPPAAIPATPKAFRLSHKAGPELA